MPDKKYLDQEGLKYLWSKTSMQDYPNNEVLVGVINAIDETKQDKITGLEGQFVVINENGAPVAQTIIQEIDTTLTKENIPAEAQAVGEELAKKQPIGNYVTDEFLFDTTPGSSIARIDENYENLECFTEYWFNEDTGENEYGNSWYKISDISLEALVAMKEAIQTNNLKLNLTFLPDESTNELEKQSIDLTLDENFHFLEEDLYVIATYSVNFQLQIFIIGPQVASVDNGTTPTSTGIWVNQSIYSFIESGEISPLELSFNDIPLTTNKIIKPNFIEEYVSTQIDSAINGAIAASY